MAQLDPEPTYDHRLAERVITYLQTNDWRLFPFSQGFDDARQRAFSRDLREGLAEVTPTRGKRGTSATGFPVSDRRLLEIVQEWAVAKGGWPTGADPRNPVTSLGSVSPEDDPTLE